MYFPPIIKGCLSIFCICFISISLFSQETAATSKQDPSVIKPLAYKSLMLDVQAIESVIYTVGDLGHILKSSDRGETWQQCSVPTRVMLTSVFFVDADNGWAVGHNETILHTVDAGKTWILERQNFDRDPYLDIYFENNQHGIIAGAYGVLMETQDGGKTWSERTINDEDDFHLNQIKSAKNGYFYIASERDGLNERGVSYRSEDGGETWITLDMPYTGSYFGILPLEEETVLVFGLRGHIFRSEDAGQNWEEIVSGTNSLLNDGIHASDGTIYIAGMGGTVLISTDNGKSFTQTKQSHKRGLSSITETKEGQILFAGEGGIHLLEEN